MEQDAANQRSTYDNKTMQSETQTNKCNSKQSGANNKQISNATNLILAKRNLSEQNEAKLIGLRTDGENKGNVENAKLIMAKQAK